LAEEFFRKSCQGVVNFVKIDAVKVMLTVGLKLNYACMFCIFHMTWIKFSLEDQRLMQIRQQLSAMKIGSVRVILLGMIVFHLYFPNLLSDFDKI
jgi:hypothetical protein